MDELNETRQLLAPHEVKMLANRVENNEGGIIRISNQRQKRRDRGKRNLFVGQRERPDCDQRVVKHSYRRRHTIDPLEAESQINQHSCQRVNRRQQSLFPKLRSNLRSYNLYVPYCEVGNIKTVW